MCYWGQILKVQNGIYVALISMIAWDGPIVPANIS